MKRVLSFFVAGCLVWLPSAGPIEQADSITLESKMVE
jgi:hypothetical protein